MVTPNHYGIRPYGMLTPGPMDPLSLLRNKVATLSSSRAYTGLLAAIKHLDIASGHLERGRSGADGCLFTDALLRIDRAFDAVVAELHSLVFTDEAPPNRIEASASRLIDSGALSKRAGELLASYLSSWRNLVDNDLQFAASEQDAYLAYLQAAALFGVLFDEIVQRQAYQSEKEKSEQRLETLGSAGRPQHPERSPNGTTLRESLIQLLEAFARTLPEASNGAPAAPIEGQLMGRLRGFLGQCCQPRRCSSNPRYAAQAVSCGPVSSWREGTRAWCSRYGARPKDESPRTEAS